MIDATVCLSSVVFNAEAVCFTKHVRHLAAYMTNSTHDRKTAIAALMDVKEGRELKEGRTAEEPEETENCEVCDVQTLPV